MATGGKVKKGDGQTRNGFNRRTGIRNRRIRCDGGDHLALGRPIAGQFSRNEPVPFTRSPGSAQGDGSSVKADGNSGRAQSFSSILDLGSQVWCMREEIGVLL